MAYDGIVTAAACYELSGLLKNGRIDKVTQCESDEITLGIYAAGEHFTLLLSANASNPRFHLTTKKKEAPLLAPPFCMVLRKYIQGGRILDIKQNGYDRVVTFTVEHANEMGDFGQYRLVIEIMSRHSNIILLNESDRILDSIKHIDSSVNSYREVMPGRPYIAPPPQEKISPDDFDAVSSIFNSEEYSETMPRPDKYLLKNISGFSPLLSGGICDMPGNIRDNTLSVCKKIRDCEFSPVICYDNGKPKDFNAFDIISGCDVKRFNTINSCLDCFYTEKDTAERLIQKKSTAAKNISVAIERCQRKLDEQNETIRKNSDFEKYRIEGELLTANLYLVKPGMTELTVDNYYTDPVSRTTIKLDENIAPNVLAQKLFKKYRKGKSSVEQAASHAAETQAELDYLYNVRQALSTCTTDEEITEVRIELKEQGYIKFGGEKKQGHKGASKKLKPSKPLKFVSSDGYEILVGKNNLQNDTLTTKTASPADMWLHVRNVPGSHVIIRVASVEGRHEIPDSTILEAASLAAFYSSLSSSPLVDVDYTTAKNVKKISGARPGMVNYYNYKTVRIEPKSDI